MSADLATTEKPRPAETSPLDLAEIAYGHELELEERVAERLLWRQTLKGVLIALPICLAIWFGIMALAIATSDTSQGYWVPLAVVTSVGFMAAVFFGGMAVFLMKADALDEIDRKSHHAPPA
jgi:peptidoglycan/LPS O-acetylase OafA/YrhL